MRYSPAAAEAVRARRDLLEGSREARYTRRSRRIAACAPVASLEKESPSRQGAAVFENSTACALGSFIDPVCVQVRSADPSRARRT